MSRLTAALLAALLAACGGDTPVEEPEAPPAARRRVPTPEQQVAARHVIAAWLQCEECVGRELDGLVQLGAPLAEPTLVATLLGGPSPAALAMREHDLRARHPDLVEFSRTHSYVSVSMDRDQYVSAYLANFVALQRIRRVHRDRLPHRGPEACGGVRRDVQDAAAGRSERGVPDGALVAAEHGRDVPFGRPEPRGPVHRGGHDRVVRRRERGR